MRKHDFYANEIKEYLINVEAGKQTMFGLMLYKYNIAQQIVHWTSAKRNATTQAYFSQATDVW